MEYVIMQPSATHMDGVGSMKDEFTSLLLQVCVINQDERSAFRDGWDAEEPIKLGAAERIVPLSDMAAAVLNHVSRT